MALFKVTMRDVQFIYRPRNPTMNNVGIFPSYDMQARIEPPPIPLIKVVVDGDCTTHIIKVKIWRNPSSASSKTYNANMNTFNDG